MSSPSEDIEKAFEDWQACQDVYQDLELRCYQANQTATQLSNDKSNAAKAEKAAWQKVAELREKLAPR